MRRVTVVLALVGGAALAAALLSVRSAASAPLRAAAAPTISSFTPGSGPFGTKITVNGAHLTGATAVKVNGTAASSVTVVSDAKVTAVVAAGSSTGKVSVVTPGGTGTSAGTFTMTPGFTNLKLCAATNARPADPSDPGSALACTVDQRGTSFAPGDALVCGFEEYNAAGHTAALEWTHNGVVVAPAVTAPIKDAPNDADHWFWWGDQIHDPSIATGTWACRIKLDGAVVATDSVTVLSSGATRAPLSVYASYLDSLDPAVAYNTESWRILSPTCAGLVGWKDGPLSDARSLFPDAATAMPTVSSDGLTYTFTVRSGMPFMPSGNGSVTPQSFVRAFQRAARVPGSSAGYFAGIVQGFDAYANNTASSISGLTVVGSQLKIKLTAKNGNFLARLAMPFFCAVPANEPLTAQTSVPSAGPYSIAAGASTTTGARLLRNMQYGGHRPHGAAEIDVIVAPSTSKYAVWDDAVDAGFAYSKDDWAEIFGQYGSGTGARAFQWSNGLISQLTFDTANSHVTASVRKAIAKGIDRTAITNAVGGVPTSSLLSTNEAGYTGTGPYGLTANVAGARTLMAGAGYSSGHHLALTLVTCLSASCGTRASLIAQELAQIYIDLTVTQVQNVYGSLGGTEWGIALTGWVPDFNDPWDNLGPLFATGGPANNAKYASPSFDSALASADAKTGTDRASAFATLATNLATGDVPATTYAAGIDVGFFSTRIECVRYGAFGVNLALLNDRNTGAACGTDASE
jgi:ABC-type oligopeptide transport system substrate-binding subunit